MIARMKLIPVDALIRGKRLVLIDDSIVRGTQLKETTEFLYHSGAKEVHVRTGCPPILFGCKYLNFSSSKSDMDLIARRMIERLEGDGSAKLELYSDPNTPEYAAMVEEVRKEMHFTSLKYLRLDDIIAATGLPADRLCTYCWDGKE
jgi:amidophosphoribosyltransferase